MLSPDPQVPQQLIAGCLGLQGICSVEPEPWGSQVSLLLKGSPHPPATEGPDFSGLEQGLTLD